MIKENRCFRYSKIDYFANNIEVLCKNQVMILNQQIIFDLKAMEVETTFKHLKSDMEN